MFQPMQKVRSAWEFFLMFSGKTMQNSSSTYIITRKVGVTRTSWSQQARKESRPTSKRLP